MNEKQDTIVVFTARSPDRIIREGGSQAWKLKPARAKQCAYLVCTQNRHNPDHEFSDATEPHGTAFLVGKISGIRSAPEEANSERWQIAISEFARIHVPDAWDHGRNPVRYTSLDDLGINLEKIKFQPMPQGSEAAKQSGNSAAAEAATLLTIPEAKKRLAVTFGVKPEAIEITIRG
jgi:hypothetical protein